MSETINSNINEIIINSSTEQEQYDVNIEEKNIDILLQEQEEINAKIIDNTINVELIKTNMETSIETHQLNGIVSEGILYYRNIFVPYIDAIKDVNLGEYCLYTDGCVDAGEIVAENGITLNGVRITQWPVGEWVNWGDVIGDINNQLDLMGKLSEKQDKLEYIPENVENKSSDINLGDSDILYPTQKAVKTYVDTVIDGVNYNQVEVFTINETILNQKYVILTKEITDINSVRVFVDDIGIRAQPGIDYSISDQYIYWNGYDLNTKLEIGEKIIVFYY